MAVRAKFRLQEITTYHWSPAVKRVLLRPEYDPTIAEDQRFATATPTGEFWMQVNNPFAVEQLVLGKQYYIDITEVPE